MPFELNNEKATDVLIWWMEGSDGSIDYREEEAVKRVLSDVSYSLETFYEETMLYLSGMSTEKLKDLVGRSIEWGKNNFDDHRKQRTIALLYAIAEANDKITPDQQEKIDRVKKAFGVEDLEKS